MRCAPRTRRSGGVSTSSRPRPIGASAALQPGTYPLINAATLSLLSGDRAQAEEIAREVLERIAREPDEPETPYWRAATEAEALLLLGRTGEARAALDGGGGGGAAGLGGPCLDAPPVPRHPGRARRRRRLARSAAAAALAPLFGGAGGGRRRAGRRSAPCCAMRSRLRLRRAGGGRRDRRGGSVARARRRAPCRPAVGPGELRGARSSTRMAATGARRFDAALAAAESVEQVRPLRSAARTRAWRRSPTRSRSAPQCSTPTG